MTHNSWSDIDSSLENQDSRDFFFDDLDRYAAADLTEGAEFEYEGEQYEVQAYESTSDGYHIRGAKVNE